MWELSRSHAGDYTGGFICFICPSPDSSALGLVSRRFYLWWDTTNRVESLLLFSLIHSPMTQDSHEGAWSSGFALLVSQHSICVFQSTAKLQPSSFRVQNFSTYLWSSLHRVYWIWKTQRREPALLQITLLTNFLAPCWEWRQTLQPTLQSVILTFISEDQLCSHICSQLTIFSYSDVPGRKACGWSTT